MKTVNCYTCRGYGSIQEGYSVFKCSYCQDNKKIILEFIEWERSKAEFRKKTKDFLEALMSLKLEVAIEDWLIKNKKPRKFPKV
ncbi:hypothetical protein LCGC14_3139350 [marine sediment metagenome]|uniref:Uncharacterized protein n=1 Tax=marine sediment metagenome TaxID=412755 RepID=A0A0F8YLQ4_9ZZZZ